jgi:hypothetical protein
VWRKASQNRQPPPACAQRLPAATKPVTWLSCRTLHGFRAMHCLRKKTARCMGDTQAHLQAAVHYELSLRNC